MSQPQTSPLSSTLFHLKFPRSLGTYSTYAEVQKVVDTLADHEFAVQNTMIVGTDLKLIERVTGRQTWGRVIGGGILSGIWMGLFVGILFSLVGGKMLANIVLSVLMGAVFFTVWAVIGYAMSGGRRDFTSMTATIPMQYELLVEHTHADAARQILVEAGAAPAAEPERARTAPVREGRPSYGQPAAEEAAASSGSSAPAAVPAPTDPTDPQNHPRA